MGVKYSHLFFFGLFLPTIVGCTIPLSSSSIVSSLPTTIEVSFDTQLGTEVPSQTLPIGGQIDIPENPTKQGYFFLYWYGEDPTTPWDVLQPITNDLTLSAHWEEEILTPAVMHIQLDIPIDWVSREQYEDATFSLTDTQTPWLIENAPLVMRGRGNGSSWGYEQKGYRLKFNEKIDLFGEVASRHWVLTPGGHDFGVIRNHAAFKVGKEVMTGIPFTSSSRYVEVYFNDYYHGLYNLFEHVRVDEGRIDIDSDYGVLDTGYLLELDAYATGIDGIDYFYVQGLRYPLTVKSPEPDEWQGIITEEQFREQIIYIQGELQTFVTAIYEQNESLIIEKGNVASFVDMYLLHELFKNTDSGWSSFFLYREPSGQWTFGPPWDFDLTAGISRGDTTTSDLYVAETIMYYSDFTSSELMMNLMAQSWFVNRVKERYLAISEAIALVVQSFALIQIHHEDAFIRHSNRWYWFSAWEKEHDQVIEWLLERNQWLYHWAQG